MRYLDEDSLFDTVDNVSEALFYGKPISRSEKREIASFIVGRHGEPYTYGNTFAPTAADLDRDLVLFTGERVKTGASKCHVIGEEASRVLRRLDLGDDDVSAALREADEGMRALIYAPRDHSRHRYGMYCCPNCSCGMWLNLSSGGIGNDEKLLRAGMDNLKEHRDGAGRWTRFPYYYVLYILGEMESSLAKAEIEYAAARVEIRLRRKISAADAYETRRVRICERVLERS